MVRGTPDADLAVGVYVPEKVYNGTTLLPDNHVLGRPRVIEVNMLGEIIWEYPLPGELSRFTNPGFDVELLPSNNLLLMLPRYGILEVDRRGQVVWSYRTAKSSHDADRLPNGNTIFVFGNEDQKGDAQVTEVNPKGEIVWAWYARDHFDKPPYSAIYAEGWTHTNAVQRLSNGNTLISLRNFNLVAEVAPSGSVVRTLGEGILDEPHDPVLLPDGNLLSASHNSLDRSKPQWALEIEPGTGRVVWQFPMPRMDSWPVRDANRLPNGNTLVTGANRIVEVTPGGEVVWNLALKVTFSVPQDAAGLGFYKAERIGIP